MVTGMNDLGRRVSNRVLRGGSFNNNVSNVRSANRNTNQPDNRNNNNGFRVASTLPCRNSPVVLFRQFPGGACLSVKSRSSSRVGLLFVSPTNGRSAKCKTDPAGLVGRKARTRRRIICCRILPRLASPDASNHVAMNPESVIKLMASKVRFLAGSAIARILLI